MNGTAMPNYILDQHLEEQVAEKWKLLNIYEKLMDRTEAERFTLREMPIAVDSLDCDNLAARIHQDIFLKNNLQQNIYVDYKPHWDYCAPSIQQQVLNTEPKESHDVLAFRNQYKQHFQTAIVARKQELEALGMFADWKNSTKNLCNRNESKILTSFNKLRAQKQIETDQKLEVWCYNRNTVVDEDDFEIRPTEVLSGYVKFPMKVGFEEFGSSMSIIVSIQEIWQVVATVAIGIRTDQRYFIAKLGEETVITAESDILEDKLQLIRPIDSEQVAECICMHPILNSDIPIVQLSDANNWDGISHIAPGHDPDHYIIAKTKALPISSVIDNTGYLNEATNMFYGLKIAEAEKIIESELAKRNYLVQTSKSVVQLPYCNMSKCSVIYRLVHKWNLAIDRSVVTKLVNCDQNWEG
ncbi:MAG: class I tRNA ligase family protein, partial [Candidatus Poribacteria bacterium]|nr:class I tRNA ligase family protein [Candidatus Poribacteria bacterium]